MFTKFLEGIRHGTKNNRLHFGIDSDLNLGLFPHFSSMRDRLGVFRQ